MLCVLQMFLLERINIQIFTFDGSAFRVVGVCVFVCVCVFDRSKSRSRVLGYNADSDWAHEGKVLWPGRRHLHHKL